MFAAMSAEIMFLITMVNLAPAKIFEFDIKYFKYSLPYLLCRLRFPYYDVTYDDDSSAYAIQYTSRHVEALVAFNVYTAYVICLLYLHSNQNHIQKDHAAFTWITKHIDRLLKVLWVIVVSVLLALIVQSIVYHRLALPTISSYECLLFVIMAVLEKKDTTVVNSIIDYAHYAVIPYFLYKASLATINIELLSFKKTTIVYDDENNMWTDILLGVNYYSVVLLLSVRRLKGLCVQDVAAGNIQEANSASQPQVNGSYGRLPGEPSSSRPVESPIPEGKRALT
jgi:hypothetical protein